MPRTTTSVTRRTWGPRKKYSLARSAIGATVVPAQGGGLGAQQAISIVASIAGQGKRKCKNFDIQLASQIDASEDPLVYYALVYVPTGSVPGDISNATNSQFYSPPSNVLAAGVYDCSQGTGFRVRTRLARNLNAGDQVVLLLRAQAGDTTTVDPGSIRLYGLVTYVVAYN